MSAVTFEAVLAGLRQLIEDNPGLILADIISEWEAKTGKKLYPAQSDNFVLNELAARESNVCTQMIYAMLQNYVRTASGVFLEALGEFWGVKRLTEAHMDEEGNQSFIKELDDRLRERILLAPEAITSCGTVGAYRYFVLSCDLSITDVDFSTPDDGSGRVHATVLTREGVPDSDLLNKVYHTLSDEKNAVLCVAYSVSSPELVNYALDIKITVYDTYLESPVRDAVEAALFDYTGALKETLGKDVVISQLMDVIHNVEGVYQAKIEGFPDSGVIRVFSGDEHPFGALEKIAQWPVCDSLTVTVEGKAYG